MIDTGIGIREEVLPQLFQPFNQGDLSVSQKFGGTGLGLAISHHIAHLLGGDLTATSAWGQGSTFTLTVPTGSLEGIRMLQHPTEMEHETAGHVWQPAAEDLQGVRVLLAEDGFDNRELIRAILQRAGAEVETAENGRLAVAKAENDPFDVILMDMNMPEMDGYEATRLLRDRGYRGPILALTANAMSDDCERCLAAGCDEYLTKPIDRVRLIQTIAAHVGTKARPGVILSRRRICANSRRSFARSDDGHAQDDNRQDAQFMATRRSCRNSSTTRTWRRLSEGSWDVLPINSTRCANRWPAASSKSFGVWLTS